MELVCKPKNITVPMESSKKVVAYSETAPDDSPAIRIQFDYPAEDKSIVAVLYGENLKKATSGIKKINIQVSECVKCSNQNRKYTHQNAELLLLNTIVNKTGNTITGTLIITNSKQNIPFSTTIMSGIIP